MHLAQEINIAAIRRFTSSTKESGMKPSNLALAIVFAAAALAGCSDKAAPKKVTPTAKAANSEKIPIPVYAGKSSAQALAFEESLREVSLLQIAPQSAPTAEAMAVFDKHEKARIALMTSLNDVKAQAAALKEINQVVFSGPESKNRRPYFDNVKTLRNAAIAARKTAPAANVAPATVQSKVAPAPPK